LDDVERGQTWRVDVTGEEGIVASRQQARSAAKSLGFGLVDQSRIATAVSELARNIVRYATGSRGEVIISELRSVDTRTGLEIVVRDEGPGIADVSQALRDGYTSGQGLGMGLPGAKRLMDELTIDSAPGHGTSVTIRKWQR
jgi:serine/threonine-protein kinase RsbT